MEMAEKTIVEINDSTLQDAKTAILAMVTRRKLIVKGEIPTQNVFSFESKSRLKDFRDSLVRVIKRPTMKSANIYLSKYKRYSKMACATVEYSEVEKQIIKAREEWKELREKAMAAREAYKLAKGSFYKS